MKNYKRQIVKIIQEISAERGYEFSSFADGFCLEVSCGENSTRIFGYQFDNLSSSSMIATDKCACFELLKLENIPAVPHFLILPPEKAQFVANPLKVEDFLEKYPEIVAKPCKGTSGVNVYKFSTMEKYRKIQEKIMPYSRDIALSPYLELTREFRCVLLRGKPLLIYEKIRREGWKHNLSHGAMPQIMEIGSHKEIESLAIKTAAALNLDFCAVDIVMAGCVPMVLEVNSGAMFEKFSTFSDENYQIAKDIYAKALKHFLKEE